MSAQREAVIAVISEYVTPDQFQYLLSGRHENFYLYLLV